jgi:hypothetical protein
MNLFYSFNSFFILSNFSYINLFILF